MSTLHERISAAIHTYLLENNLKKIDRNEMAAFCRVSVAAVGQWINGKTNSLDGYTNARVAQYLNVNPHWLAGDPKYSMDSDLSTLDNNVDYKSRFNLGGAGVPVISWVAAGSFSPIETVLRDVEVDEYLPPIQECGRNGYGLIVTGESMLPKFEPGDRIYVNPDFQVSDLKTNDLVIVACNGDSEATFKKLIVEGGGMFLEPLNPDWPEKIIKLSSDCRLVGKVVGLYRKI